MEEEEELFLFIHYSSLQVVIYPLLEMTYGIPGAD